MEAKYNALVEIRVPKTDGSEGIGTGYPVAKNRILTARHVLHPDGRDEAKPIEVRWYYKNGKAHEFRPIKKIAWERNEQKVDVAVLDCEFPEDAQSFLRLVRIKPVARAPWDSKGFARAATSRGWEREPVGLQGTTHEMADAAWRFEVDVDTSPKILEGWAGGSGCPVFVRDQIYGVVVTVLENFDQKKLEAVAIWRLLDAFDDFCREVGYSTTVEREKQLEFYHRGIADELRQTPEAIDQLERLAGIVPTGGGDRAERMARALIDPDLETCNVLYEVFHANLQAKRLGVALVISKIANLALPAVLGEEDAIKVRGRDEGTTVVLRCYTRTFTELIMAKCDGREAKFRPPTANEKQLRGVHEISSEPESGIRRNAVDDLKKFNMMLERIFFDIEQIETWEEEEKISELKLMLNRLSKKATKYFIFLPSDIYPNNIELMSKAKSINQLYPEIAFLLLSKPMECKNRDTTLLFGNEKMLIYTGDGA